MLQSKSEKAARVLAVVSQGLFFIPELFHVLASPLKIGSVLCLFGIAVLAFIAVERVVFNTQLQFVFICV